MVYSGDTPILGQGTVTAAAIDAWFAERGPAYKGYAPDGQYRPAPEGIGQVMVTWSAQWGVNHDLVAAQILHESAAWQSKIVRDKNNPSGLGAVNDNAYAGAVTFATPGDGIRATIAHLLVYAVGEGPWAALDPRYEAVRAAGWLGAAPTLSGLNGKWAHPGTTYGQGIARLANELVAFAGQGGFPVANPYEHIIPGLIDVRDQLATREPGAGGVERGPYERIPLSEKRGAVIHYRGVVTAPDAGLSSYKADAEYHVGKNWVSAGQTPVLGSGIMYHVGVDGAGNSYLMRDLDRVLWHCGAWPQNADTLAIQLPLGGSQRATPVQLERTRAILDDWLAFTGAGRDEVWGHQQLSSTTCPGTLMGDLVIPYRTAVAPPPVPRPSTDPLDHVVRDPWRDYAGGNQYGEFFIPTVFVDWINANGGFWAIGRVVTGAFLEDGMLVQYFEGGRLEWHPENAGTDYAVLRGHTGLEVLAERHPERMPNAA